MAVEAVMYVESVIPQPHTDQSAPQIMTVHLRAAFGSYLNGLSEEKYNNKDWSKWTPSGELTLTITNPGAYEQFSPGDVFSVLLDKVSA